ncbi:MAG: accessory factor UbiK family protein [Alphaproteobacteria bacterium]
MQNDPPRLFDDLAKMATNAAGALTGVRDEVEGLIKQQAERLISQMDLVPREEFDVVKAMARKAREENEALKARIEALEQKAGIDS